MTLTSGEIFTSVIIIIMVFSMINSILVIHGYGFTFTFKRKRKDKKFQNKMKKIGNRCINNNDEEFKNEVEKERFDKNNEE